MSDRVRVSLELDLRSAINEIDDLERRLDFLAQPIDIPINITGEQALDNIAGDLNRAEGGFEEIRREADRAGEEIEQVGEQSRRAGREIEDVGKRGVSAFGSLKQSVGGVFAGLAAVVGAREIISFFTDSIQAASNLEESLSKTRVVFGEFSSDIEEFASTGPRALGLSNQAALEATSTFGNLFTALGLSQEAAADLSPEIIQLAADLASFNNISVDDAITSLRSGLVGEVEPLRRLGVAINATTVEAKAMELGLASASGEVSEAAKVQARYALILEQTTNAQGDFARTADGIANKQRTLAAVFEDFQANVGQALVPAFEALLDVTPQLLEGLEGLIPVIADGAGEVANMAEGLPEAIAGFRKFGLIAGGVLQSLLEADTDGTTGIENLGRALQLNLIDRMERGEDAVSSFQAVIERFGESRFDFDAAQVQSLVGSLLDIQNLDDTQIRGVLDVIQDLEPSAALTAEEIHFLGIQFAAMLRPAGAVAPDIEELRRGIEGVGAAAAGATPVVITFLDALDAPQQAELDQFLGAVDAAVVALADQMSATQEAMRTSEGEIVDDFDTFLDNLQSELTDRAAFASNVNILRAMGLDDLAAKFEAVGVEANQLLADGLSDPAALIEAERLLDDQLAAVADNTMQAFLDSPAFDNLSLPIKVNIIAEIASIAWEQGNFTPPPLDELRLPSTLGPAPNTIIQNFYTEPDETTTTARIGQIVRAI